MSDRLTVSATLSVLMMASYVLLGADASRVPLGPEGLASAMHASMPDLHNGLQAPGRLLPTLLWTGAR